MPVAIHEPAALASGLLLLAACAICRGSFDPLAIPLLFISLILGVRALLGRRTAFDVTACTRVLVLGIGLLVTLGLLLGSGLARERDPSNLMRIAMLAQAVVAIPMSRARPILSVVLVSMCFLITSAHAIFMRDLPRCDVWMFQQDAASSLLTRDNPYETLFVNPYGPDTPFYGPGVVNADQTLSVSYPYPPLSVMAVAPGRWIGDVRWVLVIALLWTAWRMVRVRPDRVGALAAVALLVAPQSLMTVLTGWNESIALLPAVIWLVALSRRNRLAWLWLAIAISMKQYMVLAIPVALLMMSWRDVMRAIIVAFLIALPFVLWNFDAFWRSVVVFHFMQNFRDDALTLSAALVRTGGPELPGAVGLLCFGLILGIAWTRRLRGPTLIAATLAVGLLAFFAFNRQAFGNYYLLVAGLLLVTPLIGTKSTMTTTRTLAVNPYDPIESAVNDYQSPQRTSATAI
jgi:hypothetical protein